MLLLSRFSHVRLCVTPETAAHQASLSLGFSRQEHWSGLPFPSPMHESEKVKVKSFSLVWLLATPWTAAYQARAPMGFSRQEYWSGLPFPSPGDLPDTGIKPRSPALQSDALTSERPGKPAGIKTFTQTHTQDSNHITPPLRSILYSQLTIDFFFFKLRPSGIGKKTETNSSGALSLS